MLRLFVALLVMPFGLAVAQEAPISHLAGLADKAIVNGTFYTGNLNWYWQPGGASSSLTMRGYDSTDNGGTITQVTACLHNESSFSRRFTAEVAVEQNSHDIQSITFSRDFPASRFTCHTLTGFSAVVAPGNFGISVSYNIFTSDNIFAGLASTDAGQIFDVQIGSSRPPYASGPQGPIQIRGVGIKYRMNENDAPPPPPPACVRDNQTACLLNGRFKVTVTWQTNSNSGSAQVMYFEDARAENDQSVFMSFFNGDNFEMGIKMVNACAPPFNKFWAFVSGLTNQGFTVTILDTTTGAFWTHENIIGELPTTRGDSAAFDCP